MLNVAATFWEEGSMPHVATQAPHAASPQSETAAPASLPNREKALRILSKSIYKELRQNGYDPKQIVALSSELISLVTTEIKEDDKANG